MPAPVVSYSFTNGNTADGPEVSTNFTDVINAITDGTKDLAFNSLILTAALTVGGSAAIGNSISDTHTITGPIASIVDISHGGLSLTLGADDGAATRTNVTTKNSRLSSYHYTNSEEPFGLLYGTSTSTTNVLNIGGGTSSQNAATTINFYAAANNTTTTGTSVASITTSGLAVTGSLSASTGVVGTPLNFSSELLNLGLSCSVGSNLLTVNLKQKDGATDPASGSGVVTIAFRDSTLDSGLFVQRTVSSSLSINTVATGATLGLKSAQSQYIYVYAIDNAGTVELALAGSRAFDEGTRYSTTAISGSATRNDRLYSTTSRSNVAIRLIGRLSSNQTVSGTYATAISEISLRPFGKPGVIAELILNTAAAYGTATKIRRFTTTEKLVGDVFTYVDSSGGGTAVSIGEDGMYAITYEDNFTATSQIGISLNSSSLTTNLWSLTRTEIVAATATGAANFPQTVSATLFLQRGDIIRPHGEGAAVGTGPVPRFRIVQLSQA